MCDPATAQRRLEEWVADAGTHTIGECDSGCYFRCAQEERKIFAALNAACLSEGDET